MAMAKLWSCPKCNRRFTQINQRHACGTGDRNEILRNRPAHLVELYGVVEAYATSLGTVEVVTRQRYALFRSTRIFADLTVMTDAVRLVMHLRRRVEDPMFCKIVSDEKTVSHVAKLRTHEDWMAVKSYMREAYEISLQ